jgi:hypothetical protein
VEEGGLFPGLVLQGDDLSAPLRAHCVAPYPPAKEDFLRGVPCYRFPDTRSWRPPVTPPPQKPQQPQKK